MKKQELRDKYRAVRDGIDKEIRRIKSARISEKLFELPQYKSAETVMAYSSFGSEVDTRIITERVLEEGKTLLLPKCLREDKRILAYSINNAEQLEPGSYGILEPSEKLVGSGALHHVMPTEIDLVLVPGICFDFTGRRIGYGAGYYDRFLRDFCGFSVGLEFYECMAERIVQEYFDVRVDTVIYE